MPGIDDSKCVLVVGSTAGIGKSLALAVLALPSNPTVIISGRRQERLDDIISEHGKSGRLAGIRMDIDSDRASLKKTVSDVLAKYPKLDTVIFAAGIQRRFDFANPESVELDLVSELVSELNTNYTAIVTVITYLLPHMLKLGASGQPCFIVPITSGLAITPSPWVPNYGATKAALHSFSVSLSFQLTDTNVRVMEIFPPLVESELHDREYTMPFGELPFNHAEAIDQGTTDKLSRIWMPVEEFTGLAMDGLKRGDVQIPVGNAKDSFEKFEKGKMEVVKGMINKMK
ncbi:hypothetical protein HWV62_19833 [Athelia sp. TMB]|nr:hypothetical protein HWV62_19833 [Athelia sp. TMB]